MFVRLSEKFWTDFTDIFRTCFERAKDQVVTFWWCSGFRSDLWPLGLWSLSKLLGYVSWYSSCLCFCWAAGGSRVSARGRLSAPTAALAFSPVSKCSGTFYSHYLTLHFHRGHGWCVTDLLCGATYHTDERLKHLLVMEALSLSSTFTAPPNRRQLLTVRLTLTHFSHIEINSSFCDSAFSALQLDFPIFCTNQKTVIQESLFSYSVKFEKQQFVYERFLNNILK